MTKNAVLLQYTEQTEPFSFIDIMFSLWHFFLWMGVIRILNYSSLIFRSVESGFSCSELIFTIRRNRIQFLYVIWVKDGENDIRK